MTIVATPDAGLYEACKLAAAKVKNAPRFSKVIRIKKGFCHATDGRSLLRCTADGEWGDGCYTVAALSKRKVVLTKADETDYPGVERCIDRDGAVEIETEENVGLIMFRVATLAGVALDPKLLDPLARNIDTLGSVRTNGTDAPVQFDFTAGWSLIVMPLNSKGDENDDNN